MATELPPLPRVLDLQDLIMYYAVFGMILVEAGIIVDEEATIIRDNYNDLTPEAQLEVNKLLADLRTRRIGNPQ